VVRFGVAKIHLPEKEISRLNEQIERLQEENTQLRHELRRVVCVLSFYAKKSILRRSY
jgi:regulator of replication initiation timing